MRVCVLRTRSGRVIALFTVATLVAAGLVLFGAGPQHQADAAVSPGTTQLVSVDQDTTSAASGQAAISANGRYVAFSTSRSLDPRDVPRGGASDVNNVDVYVRDLQDQRTVLLSGGSLLPAQGVLSVGGLLGLLGGPANGPSGNPSISADGRYVAFQTGASNLGVQDLDVTSDVVVVDRDPDGNGILDDGDCRPQPYCHQVTRISPEWFDDQGRALTSAGAPSISAAGDALAWVGVSLAEQNSVQPGEDAAGGVPVVYRSTLEKGPTGAITAVRSQQVRPQAEGLLVRGVSAPVLSGDGRRLAMVAETGPQSGSTAITEARSAVLGVDLSAAPLPETEGEEFPAVRLDVDENGAPLALPPGFRAAPSLSGDGRLAALTTPGAGSQVVRTTTWETGQGPRSRVISTDSTGAPVDGRDPALSANGRYLAFTTSARGTHNGVDGPAAECEVPAATTEPGAPAPGAPTPGAPTPGAPGTGLLGTGLLGTGLGLDAGIDAELDPRISLDPNVEIGIGRRPAEPAPAPQPADPAVVSHCDVVVRDLALDQARAAAGLPRLPAELASPSLTQTCVAEPTVDDTCEGDDASGYPAISGDGGVVVYESKAGTLIPEDRNGHVQDVFARTFQPSLTADPLDFFVVAPGEPTVGTTTLRHVGFGPLPVDAMTISGVNGTEFTVTENCAGTTLHAGDTCPASVRFLPESEGSHEAQLGVGYRGSGAPLVIPLLGIADLQPPQAVSFTPDPLSFGSKLPLSTNPPGDVRVENTGRAPLRINAVGLPTIPDQTPQDYRITKDACTGKTVRPGESCVVTLQFSPQGIGERPAVLQLDDNAPRSPHQLTLQGGGNQPSLRFDPATVQVGRVTTLIGSGFAPRHNVLIQMPDSSGPITVTTDGAGNFTTRTVIFSTTIPGERRAEATIEGLQPPITADARLLVVS
ncbi:MAG TPA: choice-of-anchor D domain-containing protein, partial [Pseudonocardiaceae bacterium]|nr:choice-of-anchor D domain-containing protein [Pseudonocardiaceae bacterium]